MNNRKGKTHEKYGVSFSGMICISIKSLTTFIFLLISISVYAIEPDTRIKDILLKAKEPSLKEISSDKAKEIYRFSWLRSFNETLIYRVDITNSQHAVIRIVKITSGDPITIVSDDTLNLTEVHVRNLRQFLNGAQFWSLPSEDKKTGLDGSLWILEGVKNGNYHFTDRWSPLPPYFGWSRKKINGEWKTERESPPFDKQVKHSDEVGLDFLCLYIMLMANKNPEIIY